MFDKLLEGKSDYSWYTMEYNYFMKYVYKKSLGVRKSDNL